MRKEEKKERFLEYLSSGSSRGKVKIKMLPRTRGNRRSDLFELTNYVRYRRFFLTLIEQGILKYKVWKRIYIPFRRDAARMLKEK